WRNHDAFVAHIADILLRFDGALVNMFVPDRTLAFLTMRRSARVNYLRFSWWIAVVFVVALPVRYSAEWAVVLSWASRRAPGWITRAIGLQSATITRLAAPSAHDFWCSVGLLAFILVAYAITRSVWSTWNRVEMHELPLVRRVKSHHLRFL